MIRYLILSFLFCSCINYHSQERFIKFEQISGRKIHAITFIGCDRYFIDCKELKLKKQILIEDSIVHNDQFNAHFIYGNTSVVNNKIKLGYYKGALLSANLVGKQLFLKLYFSDLRDSSFYSFKSNIIKNN